MDFKPTGKFCIVLIGDHYNTYMVNPSWFVMNPVNRREYESLRTARIALAYVRRVSRPSLTGDMYVAEVGIDTKFGTTAFRKVA